MPDHTSRRRSFAALALFAAAFTLPAHAQFGGPPGGGGGRRGGPPDRGGPNERGGPGRDGPPELPPPPPSPIDQLYDARLRLRIDAEQSTAWDRFSRAFVRMRSSDGFAHLGPEPHLRLAEAIDAQLDAARARQSSVEEVATAVNALVAVLNEEQRRTADEVVTRMLLAPPGPPRPGRPRP